MKRNLLAIDPDLNDVYRAAYRWVQARQKLQRYSSKRTFQQLLDSEARSHRLLLGRLMAIQAKRESRRRRQMPRRKAAA